MAQRFALPPVIAVLLNEQPDSIADLHSKLRGGGLLKELQRQAEFSAETWPYVDATARESHGRFVVTPADSLNPMVTSIKCQSVHCRTELARRFACSVGLYADEIILPDVFAGRVLSDVPTESLANTLYADLEVLRVLMPLVDSGYIAFGAPQHHFCSKCRAAITNADIPSIKSLTEDLVEGVAIESISSPDKHGRSHMNWRSPALSNEFGPGVYTHELDAHQTRLFNSLIHKRRTSRLPTPLRPFFRPAIDQILRTLAVGLHGEVMSAVNAGATLAGASKTEQMFLRIFARPPEQRSKIEQWEIDRTLTLPWVDALSVSELVRLKNEAAQALPRLRTMLATRLAASEDSSDVVRKIVLELSEHAAEVEAEIGACASASSWPIRMIAGASGLSFVLFGAVRMLTGLDAATAATMATLTGGAISSVITILNAAHPQVQKERLEVEKLKTQPAYVLVKARELLTHRH